MGSNLTPVPSQKAQCEKKSYVIIIPEQGSVHHPAISEHISWSIPELHLTINL